VGAVAALGAWVVPLLGAQARQLVQQMTGLSARYDWVQKHWGGWQDQYGVLPRFSEITTWLTGQMSGSVERLIGLTGQFLTVAVGTFSVLFLAFYFLKDGSTLREQFVALVPGRSNAREVLDRITDRVGRYVLGVVANMTVVGVLTTIGLAILGVPYAAVLGLVVGVLDIVPIVGPFIGAFPGVLVAFGQGWQTGLWAIAVYFAVQQAEGYFTYPHVVGKVVRLHPAWIFLGFLTGGQLLGIGGMVLAVPTMVVAQIVMEEWYLPWVAKRRVHPTLKAPEAPEAVRFEGSSPRPGAGPRLRPPGAER
jgi:predicted PurR-regulated permease PerM